jgi:hypothetical protein
MSYLIFQDFKPYIQTDNLNQIIGNDLNVLTSIQIAAQQEALTYLKQKFDTSKEITDTMVWDFTKIYNALSRVYLDAPPYSSSATYLLNSLCLQGGNVYICTSAITAGEAFNIAHWTLLGPQYKMFFATQPNTLFDIRKEYNVGDVVYWQGKNYTCVIATRYPGHVQNLQYRDYENIPAINIFPSDTINGARYWGNGTAYTVAAGTLPTDTTKWTAGDNRSALLVGVIIDIALHRAHKRIAPHLIPELRVHAYDAAIKWLEKVAKGIVTTDLPVLQPATGNRITYGGSIKNINSY